MQKVEMSRVVLFHGEVGSYKTLSAIATARRLLKPGRYARVYSNTPCTFATSPPQQIDYFDFYADYALNSIFVIDEAGLLLKGDRREIDSVFAYPRHQNQVFLLASVLPVKQIRDYCNLFVHLRMNFSLIGIPLLQFKSGQLQQRKMPSHFLFLYSKYFRYY